MTKMSFLPEQGLLQVLLRFLIQGPSYFGYGADNVKMFEIGIIYLIGQKKVNPHTALTS